jgi:hypothetical protein
LKNPTFIVRPRLKERCRRLSAARAGRRAVERVTANHFSPKKIIVNIRNILGEKAAKEKSKGGEDWMSAPPLRKIEPMAMN